MKNFYHQNKRVFFSASIALILLGVLVFGFPIEYSSVNASDKDIDFWFFISESGGAAGLFILIPLVSILISLQKRSWSERIKLFIISIISFGGLMMLSSFLNEKLLKENIKMPRPTHLLFSGKEYQIIHLDTFYSKRKLEREEYLLQQIKLNPDKFSKIHPRVLAHWIEQSGYSFPSGHSTNSFLLGTIFSLLLSRIFPSKKYLYLLPVLWALLVCLSRVTIGVHSKYDVFFGALFGMFLAVIIAWFKLPERFIKLTEEAAETD